MPVDGWAAFLVVVVVTASFVAFVINGAGKRGGHFLFVHPFLTFADTQFVDPCRAPGIFQVVVSKVDFEVGFKGGNGANSVRGNGENTRRVWWPR